MRSFIPEMPLVPLLRLVYLWVAGIASVPGRRRRREDGGVNDAALLQRNSPLARRVPDFPNGRCASPRRSKRAGGGIRPSIRSGKISRRVFRFLRSCSRLAKLGG